MATAILLETDPLEDSLAQFAPAAGLLPVAGRPLAAYGARALRALGNVDRLVLVAPSVYQPSLDALGPLDDVTLLDLPLSSLLDQVLERFHDERELLIWPTNAPLLAPEMVEHFLANAPLQAAVSWAVVREARVRRAFPDEVHWTSQTFGAETVVPSLLGLLRPDLLQSHRPLLRRLLDNRLGAVEAGKLLGVGFALKLKSGRATLREVTRRVGELIGAPCVTQISPYPELAFRVRTRGDYRVARQRLETA